MIMDARSLYHSLDASRREIRFVTILPDEDDEAQIACRLETASLDDDPKYAAMSYVWGDATITTDILVNGIPFPATTNLTAGLLQFRRTGLGLPGKQDDASLPRLWIDAICINQQDTAERNRQVALMGDIYTSARYVLTWLGPPGEEKPESSLRLIRSFCQVLPGRLKKMVIDIVIDQFEELDDTMIGRVGDFEEDNSAEESDEVRSYMGDNAGEQQRPEIWDSNGTLTELVQAGLKWISEHPELHLQNTEYLSNSAWYSFRHLMMLSYWKRVWILQERVLCRGFKANVIHYGAETVTFEDMVLFFKFIIAIDDYGITPPEIPYMKWQANLKFLKIPIVAPIVNSRALWKRGISVPERVAFFADRYRATDPRDMVYGLRSVLHMKLDVDYTKTVRQVYLEWHAESMEYFRVWGRIEECGIGHAGRAISKDNPHDLPSWLPDLATLNEWRFVWQGTNDDMLGPGGRFELPVDEGQRYSDDGVLSVFGVAYDRVCRTSSVMMDVMSESRDQYEALKELAVDYILELKTRDHPTGRRPLEVLFYTVHQGTDPDTREKFAPTLDPTSLSARVFRLFVLLHQTTDSTHDWSHVDLEAAGGIQAYLDSRFRDTADVDPDNEHSRWFQAMDGLPEDDLRRGFQQLGASIERFLNDRVIFYTADGYIGIGPEDMQIGDQLCVINNCHLPVLLREEGSGHVLVGSVYVYGLSENEPLDMLESGKVTLERFEIH